MTEEKNSFLNSIPPLEGRVTSPTGEEGDSHSEIPGLLFQIKDAFDGEPWFGKSVTALLADAEAVDVFEKPYGEHSILELLWHMVTWKEFTLNRLQSKDPEELPYFEENDWRVLDHSDKALWVQGLQRLKKVHAEMIQLIQKQQDDILPVTVAGRSYDFRYLLNGIAQHDIYHAGQIAYITKLLKAKQINELKKKSEDFR